MTVALVNGNCEILSFLNLRHEEEVWEYSRAILTKRPEATVYIIKVANADVLDLDLIIRGPNVWDRDRMHIHGRVVAKKCAGKVSLVDRG